MRSSTADSRAAVVDTARVPEEETAVVPPPPPVPDFALLAQLASAYAKKSA